MKGRGAMYFFVRFYDRPDRLHVRKQHVQEHLDWLAARQEIVVVGPLREDPAAFPIGAIWIIAAAKREEVEALYATDPFWVHGLRERVEILHWSKSHPDRTFAF